MAKINASLADVETKYVNIPPDRYRLKIAEIKNKVEGGRQNLNFTFSVNDGGEQQGKKIYHNCSLHKKDGTPNNAGLADLKRIAMAALEITEEDAEDYDWDNLDTDDLVMKEVEGDVFIEHWKNPEKNTEGDSNRIKTNSLTPVQ